MNKQLIASIALLLIVLFFPLNRKSETHKSLITTTVDKSKVLTNDADDADDDYRIERLMDSIIEFEIKLQEKEDTIGYLRRNLYDSQKNNELIEKQCLIRKLDALYFANIITTVFVNPKK
jgi:hypothetical protein